MGVSTTKVNKKFSEMTRKERVLAALNHEPLDRVPLDYWGVPEMTQNLMDYLGAEDEIEFADKLGIDKIIKIHPIDIYPNIKRRNTWDVAYKMVPIAGGVGYYEEPEFYPIGNCRTIDEIESVYEWPRPDMFDYSTIDVLCDRYKDFAIDCGYTSLTHHYIDIRGIEQMMIDFIDNPKLTKHILMRIQEFCFENTRRILDVGNGRITFSHMTDDFASQTGLMISPAMIDEYLRGYYDQTISMIHSFGAKAFHHNDGAMTSMMPWLMDRGIDVLNPLQWHLPGWDLKALKVQYGKRICFHGGVENQHILPFGTKKEIHDEVETCLDILFSDHTGYILAPCHNIQAITPVENVIEMYKAARSYKK